MNINIRRHETDQELFWAGEFGDDYIRRNEFDSIFRSNVALFGRIFARMEKIDNAVEFGPNIGLNLRAMHFLQPDVALTGVEINARACSELKKVDGVKNAIHGSILEFESESKFDLSLAKGLLIHVNPDKLPQAYAALYNASRRYVLICEYYNPTPVAVSYHGHSERLFKRDFAGEMMDAYPDLRLIDYGFAYRRDPVFPQDDVTWFLMEKSAR